MSYQQLLKGISVFQGRFMYQLSVFAGMCFSNWLTDVNILRQLWRGMRGIVLTYQQLGSIYAHHFWSRQCHFPIFHCEGLRGECWDSIVTISWQQHLTTLTYAGLPTQMLRQHRPRVTTQVKNWPLDVLNITVTWSRATFSETKSSCLCWGGKKSYEIWGPNVVCFVMSILKHLGRPSDCRLTQCLVMTFHLFRGQFQYSRPGHTWMTNVHTCILDIVQHLLKNFLNGFSKFSSVILHI